MLRSVSSRQSLIVVSANSVIEAVAKVALQHVQHAQDGGQSHLKILFTRLEYGAFPVRVRYVPERTLVRRGGGGACRWAKASGHSPQRMRATTVQNDRFMRCSFAAIRQAAFGQTCLDVDNASGIRSC